MRVVMEGVCQRGCVSERVVCMRVVMEGVCERVVCMRVVVEGV